MTSRAPEFVLAYDASCGPCSRFKDAVKFLDARGRMAFVPLDAADGSGLLEGVAPASRYVSFHLVGPAGGLWSGPEAVLPLVRLLFPWGSAVSRMVEGAPGGREAVSFAYSTLSRLHRGCPIGAGGGGHAMSGAAVQRRG